MKICVAGWYYDGDFLESISRVAKNYEVFMVSHRMYFPESNGFNVMTIDNIGLEFGCYDFYLRNIWDGDSNVLFMHDDMKIGDIGVFDKIAELEHDCAYVFRDYAEERANGGKHGRIVYTSADFLELLKSHLCVCQWIEGKADSHNPDAVLPNLDPHTGFWYDPYNHGHVAGKPPKGVRHYNSAIEHFHWTLGRVRDQRCGPKEDWPCPEVKLDVVNRVFFEEIMPGRRNCWKHVDREIARYGRNLEEERGITKGK